ncbi:MAG: dipeptidase [Chloroflexota bacterium]
MPDSNYPPVFDGHNDTILALVEQDPEKRRDFFVESETGHIDFPRAKAGGLGGGFFAIFTRSPKAGDILKNRPDTSKPYEVPLPPAPSYSDALQFTVQAAAKLFQLEEASNGQIRIVRTADELDSCLRKGIFAVLLHIEGAEAIDADLNSLQVFYQMGLRSLGIVWSRANIFGHGVPFKFPGSPDVGPGLTDAGKALVKECNRLGILVDLSHLNEKGFWDVASITTTPLVATHSCAYKLSQSTRNLTDKQLDAVAESGGVVGVNYHVGFLRADGSFDKETSLAEIVNHTRYMVDRMGIEHVALGSDFDGAVMPQDLKDAAGLPKLMEALSDSGFDHAALEQIAFSNWVRVLKATLRD